MEQPAISISGVQPWHGFSSWTPTLASRWNKVSPIAYVSRTSPPFLLFHGAEDKLVPPRNSTDMAEKLRAAGVSAKAVVVEGEGHGSADWAEKWAKSIEQAVAFFDEHLKK
jgi:dipeptidyl aminopeptidase/acylaminoacyl peptidase